MPFVRAAFAAFALAAMISPVQAAEQKDFSQAAFAAAQAQGKPILVDVAAWWCPVCASQNSTIRKITATSQYSQLVIFKINYDKQKAEWKSFGVMKQGTLIAYRGKKETGRLAFQTDKTQIAALLASAIR